MHLRDCKCALLVNRACFYIDFTLQVGEPLMGSTNKLSAIHLLMHKDKGHPYITSGWMGSECGHFCWCSVWQYGLWIFQSGGTALERFLPKNQPTQRKLLNFENWVNGEVSKSAKIWHSKSIFYVKNYPKLSQFFSIKEHQFRSTLFVIEIFW